MAERGEKTTKTVPFLGEKLDSPGLKASLARSDFLMKCHKSERMGYPVKVTDFSENSSDLGHYFFTSRRKTKLLIS